MATLPLSTVVFLSGKKVNLCLLNAELHLNDCVRWLNDKSLTRYLVAGRFPQYHDDEREWFEKSIKNCHEKLTLAIHKKIDDKFIGMMTLERINFIHRTATTGSFIGEEENRSKGFGHDAKMILLNHAFNVLNLNKVCASAVAFNDRSIRFNQSCGYNIEGIRKQHLFVEGKYHDQVMLAVFAEDFQILWQKYLNE